jgi:hypothetical protein
MTIESKITDIRSEDRLLLCCSRTRIEEETASQIEDLLRHKIDWTYLIESAIYHRVVPLLYRSLRQISSNSIPAVVVNELQHHYESIVMNNLFLTSRLLQLINLLETHHISAIPFKGPALAFLAYGNICLRQFGDLDILVRSTDYPRTRKLLLVHGYQQVADHGYECSLVDDTDRVSVDLHQGITREQFPIHLDFQSLQQNLAPLPVAGAKIKTFCPEDMLVILCIQLAKDGWENKSLRLLKICDIAELLRTHTNMDWDRVLQKARRLGCQGILLVSLTVARELLGAPVSELPAISFTRSRLDILTHHIYNKLIHQTKPDYVRRLTMRSFHFRVRERWRDKLDYEYQALKLKMIPNERDYSILKLPASLSIIYYFLRPLRLLKKYSPLAWNAFKVKYLTWR